jgi:histidine triad (HIT) family protein
MVDCIFCRIVGREIKAKIVLETPKSLAFLDAFPLTKGHALVIPKKHYERIQDLSSDENADLFDTVRRLIAKVDKISGSTLLAVHNGKGAGQEVPHVHVHLVPRSDGDGAGPIHKMFQNRPQLSDEEFEDVKRQIA